ncbi:hypothetical protein ETD86_23695 [Nonomuraea turkmeniaca]|uniref:Shikimate kinase n=1 Tax=Nonomuraea turkmeniaca TaxID=103838 RepID=A0A5S4FF66_9ACTN|nr:hypothetical protein [Nonomuraea turkmeniaca]TMR17339.1 hypothetical protein ETD86_23695 [Nonomuraea turkmeniaca]
MDGGIDMVIVDVLTDGTAELCRESLPDLLMLRLAVDIPQAERRAQTRPVFLTPEELRVLHERQADFTAGDIRMDTTRLSAHDVAERVRDIWLSC